MTDGRLVLIDWEGRRRPRVDVIRELYGAGAPIAEIARRLGVRYQVVYESSSRTSSASDRC